MPNPKEIKVKIPSGLSFRAEILAATINKEERTVEVVFGTENPVLRNYYERFYEVLSFDKKHVRMDRLNSGANLLDNHDTYGSVKKSILGVVSRAWLKDSQGHATVRFSKREDVEPVWQDVCDGITTNVSVGYRVYKFEQLTAVKDGETPTYTATDWEPVEISMTAVPADPDAGVRSDNVPTNEAIFLNRNINNFMPPEQKQLITDYVRKAGLLAAFADDLIARGASVDEATAAIFEELAKRTATPPAPAPAAIPTPAPAGGEGVRNETEIERRRASDIMSAVRIAQLGSDFAEKLIGDGVSIDAARKAIIEKWAEADPNKGTRSGNFNVTGNRDEMDTTYRAIEDAILHRAMPGTFKPSADVAEKAKEYVQMRLLDVAEEMIKLKGGDVRGISRNEIVQRAMSTSDFPMLLSNITSRTLRRFYDSTPKTFAPLAREVSASDFKPLTRIALSGLTTLDLMDEHGEYKSGSMDENYESYSVKTYGKKVSITRKAIINDDLGGFTRIAELFGRAAANLESDLIWGLINSNVVMHDTKAIFHAAHNNLAGAGTVISVANISAGRTKMRKQTDGSGGKIAIHPEYLIVPVELETIAEQFVTSILPTKGDDVNVFANRLKVIAEPRLSAGSTTAWYLGAGADQVDMIEYAFLDGNAGLYTEQRYGFDVDGIEIKVRKDFGAGVIDYRGFYKNPGA